jgi:hypothetical protein
VDASSDSSARGYEFKHFIQQILEGDWEFEIAATQGNNGPDDGLDFTTVSSGGQPVLIQAKLTTPQTGYRLEQMNLALKGAAAAWNQEHHPDLEPMLVLAFPGVLSRRKMNLAARSGLTVWDGPYLRGRARQVGIREVPPYVASEPFDPEYSDHVGPAGTGSLYTYDLRQRLHGIGSGRASWSAYEKYCENLLNFLFVPPLNPAIPQSRDDRGANRRDYVLPNYAVDGGFWQFMRTHYDAHYVVAEVKNLSRCPGKGEILQIANYLNPHGTGLFALLLARKELDENAKWIRREQWILHNKLIVGIHDDDVHQMVATKLGGSDPAELVRQKIEDFRLGI